MQRPRLEQKAISHEPQRIATSAGSAPLSAGRPGTRFHSVIADMIGVDESTEMVVVGMALGYAEPDAIENTLLTERGSVASFTQFLG
jgi:hypothetical protein